jgi:hypothetical protein
MTPAEIKYLWHLKCNFHNADFYEKYSSHTDAWGRVAHYWRITSKGYDFINHHFYECTQVYEIEISKDSFINYLKTEPNRWDNPWRIKKVSRRVYRWAYKNPEARGYIRLPHHKKKVLSEEEIAKREYRERKGISKDKAKAYYRRGAGKFYKRYSNQKHRAWQKEKISNGDYCFSDTDYKYFCDPWLWD